MTVRVLSQLSLVCLFLLLCVSVDPCFAKKKPPLHPVNLNSADAAELQLVPGIGPSTAEKILQMRKSYGSFKSVDDLLAINGIGKKRLDKMRKYLTVGQPPSNKKPTASAQSASSPPNASPAKKSPAKPAPNKKKPPTVPTASEDEEP